MWRSVRRLSPDCFPLTENSTVEKIQAKRRFESPGTSHSPERGVRRLIATRRSDSSQ